MNFSNYFWISAMWILVCTVVTGTPRLICSVPFSIDLLKKGLKKYKPYTLFLSPVALYTTLKSPDIAEIDFSSVKLFYVAGSPVSGDAIASIKNKLTDGFAFNVYGCTEGVNITINKECKHDSIGKVLPWFEWKLINSETGKEANPGERGVLCLKSEEMLFKCYLKNPKATKEAFNEEGFYETGDVMTCDEEGFLYYVDREKEIIKFRNYQVTPTEIEAEIRKLTQVLQVCVVGKKHDDDGEHPVAFVEKEDNSDLNEANVQNIVKINLGDYKQLRGGVIFVEKIPLTNSGKVHRRAVKEMMKELNS